jgi:UrcA family protein
LSLVQKNFTETLSLGQTGAPIRGINSREKRDKTMTAQYVVAAAAAFTLISAPALAEPARTDVETTLKATVSYADLNLNTATGQAILAARIQRAAEAVCGPEPDSRDLAQLMPFRRCMKQTLDTAIAAIPSPSNVAGGAKPAG